MTLQKHDILFIATMLMLWTIGVMFFGFEFGLISGREDYRNEIKNQYCFHRVKAAFVEGER